MTLLQIAKIRKSLSLLDIEVRTYIQQITIAETVKITGLNRVDVSAWVNGRRKWSHEKLLNVAEKLFYKQ